MTTIATSERVAFFNGQRLFADDLQGLEQYNRDMRNRHNRSLHQSGVASGYAVSGNKDDREVTIQPGYAIDYLGQEIVLLQPLVLQVPPVANDGQGKSVFYDLTVSAAPDSQLEETRDGICVPRGAVRLRDEPVFCWVELVATGSGNGSEVDYQPKIPQLKTDVENGTRIRLARAEVLNCKLNSSLSVAQRRNAKPPTQPFLWAGRTPGAQPWKAVVSSSLFGIELSLRVDTSEAHFRTAPRYFAHAIGPRDVDLEMGGGKKAKLILDGFVRVVMLSDSQADGFQSADADDRLGFKFSLLIPTILIDRQAKLDEVVDKLRDALKDWYVEWLGVE